MARAVRFGIALVLIFGLTVALTGCQGIVQNAAKGAFESATGVKVDQTGDGVTVTGKDGSVTSVGGKSLPEGLPSDFPVYEGTVVTSGKMSGANGTNFSFSMETPDPAKTVSDWYKSELEGAGWTVKSTFQEITTGVSTGMMTATRGADEANVTVGEKDGTTTIISVLTVK